MVNKEPSKWIPIGNPRNHIGRDLEHKREWDRAYNKTPQRQKFLKNYMPEYCRKWSKTPKGKKSKSESNRKWRKKNGKKYFKKWRQTDTGKKNQTKHRHIYRGKKWIQILPNIFPREILIDYHHIDGYMFVAPIPRKLHESISGYNHIEKSNEWIEFYYSINPNDLLNDRIK